MTPVLEASQLAVGRGPSPVLSGIDLEVQAGARWALIGQNGCGKTTLLRALAGLDPILSGEIRWQGRPLPEGPERVRTLGVLLQHEPVSNFRVRELVALGLALDGPPSTRAAHAVDEALAATQLAALAQRRCSALSGGEAQRALLARARVAAPRLLLLDEPTNHLDPARQADFLAALDHLQAVGVVLATHDLNLAARCDRVLLLHAGRVQARGTPAQVLTPDNLAACLGVRVQRIEDPDGGAPWLRVVGPVARATQRATAVPAAGIDA